jgi:beta-lactamase superfamily II metal-dependent hydrolase
MAAGFLVIAGGFIHPLLGQLLGWLAWPFLAWTSGVVEWAATLPFASLDLSVPPWGVVLYYVVLASALVWWLARRPLAGGAQASTTGPQHSRLRTQHVLLGAAGFALILVWVVASSQPDGLLHVSFLDVGPGNATLIRTPSGQVVVIDGGPGASALIDALGRSLPFYQHEVALGVLSRAADENLVGLVSMLEHYHANVLVAPATIPHSTASERWRALIAEQAIPVTVAAANMRIDLGDGVQLVVLEGGDEATGMTLRLNYGHFSIHFDGGGAAANSAAPATVLRAAGHGNTGLVSQPLLNALTPSFIVYSLGGTRAAAPNGDTLAQLAEVGATAYRTNVNGTITFASDGERVWLETER